MSSYIVSETTIRRILWVLRMQGFYIENMPVKLLKMNIEATEQRYTDNPYLTPQQKKEVLKAAMGLQEQITTELQGLKSLRCFLYQCGEGTIPQTKLYKQLKKVSYNIMYDIITKMPEFEAAEWG